MRLATLRRARTEVPLPGVHGTARVGSVADRLAVRLGPRQAHRACWGAMLLAAILAASFAPLLVEQPSRVWLAALAAAGIITANALLWTSNRHAGVMAAFPLMALAAAILGVGWTLALI